MEKAFYYLEAPIERVTGFDIIIPMFSREKAYLPGTERICRAARKVLAAS
jgi:pyruvate dehydrogenase E1 component beta subunit